MTTVNGSPASRRGGALRRPVGIMQHLMDHHRVERGGGQRQPIHVAEPNRAVFQPSPFEIDPRDGEHLPRLVDPEREFDPRRQNFEHAASAGPDVEQITRAGRIDDLDECRFNFALVDVERANAVPLRGIIAKIGTGEVGALPFDCTQSLEIQSNCRIRLAAGRHELASQRARWARTAKAVKDPAPFAETVEQTSLTQKLQMSRYPRLALPQYLGKLAHGKLATGTQNDQPQPGRFGDRTQRG